MSIEATSARPIVKWAIVAVIVIAAGVLYKLAPENPPRPQDEAVARGPRPYTNQEVAFPSEDGSIKLAGTLSLPNGKGPFPAVVLVAAAGPEGRDEEAGGHLVFVVLADHLLREGVAVLRYDKRGVGASGGDFSKASFADLVSDAGAAFRWLVARPEIDPVHVGMIGHSEGGSICPAVAAREPRVAFVVAMAGSGLSGEFRITAHEVYVAQQDGATPAQQDKVRALAKEIFRTVAATADDKVAAASISALIDEAVASRTISASQEREVRDLMTPQFVREALTDSPIEYLKKVNVPVLGLVGSLDRIVPAGPYVEAMQPVLATIPGSRVEVIPNLNHVMQTARTGSAAESVMIEESISPVRCRRSAISSPNK